MTTDATHTIKGRVSVIVPTFNRSALVVQTLRSVERLYWPDVEVIVVDDGSTDDTRAVIEDLRADGFRWPLEYIWQTNAGPATARNRGRAQARGEFLYHLDSDDLVAPDAFGVLIDAMNKADAAYAVGLVENTDLEGVRLPDLPFSPHKIVHGDILASSWYTHEALYRRDVLDRVDGYNETLRAGEDTELHWRIIATSGWPALHDGLIATRRIHGIDHLGVEGATRSEHINTTLKIYELFFDACPDAFRTFRNAFRVLRFGSESGAMGDVETKARCSKLLKYAGTTGQGWSGLYSYRLHFLLRPNTVRYYGALNWILQNARNFRWLVGQKPALDGRTRG